MFRRVALGILFFLGAACKIAGAWDIADYQVKIDLGKDSSFVVTETINADFGYESKHGIYRDIPTTYQDENGRPYNLRFDVLSVQDENQSGRQFVEEEHTNFKRIKIGSAYQTVSGRQIYVIAYKVIGAVLFLADHDELYWNVIGSQWDVGIAHVYAAVNLPDSLSRESIKLTSYTGQRGSKASTAIGQIVSERLITFEGQNYFPYEGFTIVVGIPKGVLTQPSMSALGTYETYRKSLFGPFYLVLPVLVFIIMFNLWWRFGKDPQLNKSIVVEYKAPEDLRPAEVGTLIDSAVNQRDITSTIIDLAIRGYLKIVQQKGLLWSKEYAFILQKNFEEDNALKPFERIILQGIFGNRAENSEVKLSDLQDKFYADIDDIGEKITADLRIKKYLGPKSSFVVLGYTFLGVVLGMAGIMIFQVDHWLTLALVMSGVIVFLFGLVMPKRTIEGTQILGKILGFKEFLQRTEKDKIERSEQLDVFERMLPYAICLGISTKWATKFDGLYTQPPQWFVGNYGNVFIYDHFIHDLDHSLNSMSVSFYSSPQSVSSGGGFSSGGGGGGGFGGGGGGSW